MTDPHYLKQEAYLRATLADFVRYLKGVHPHDEAKLIEDFIQKSTRSVVSLVVDGKGNVLAVSRRFKHEDLGLPGGKLDPLEVPAEAVVRETREETGIEIEDPRCFFQRVDGSDGRVCSCFVVTKWTGEPRQMEGGIIVKWVPFARLLEESCTFRDYNLATFQHFAEEYPALLGDFRL